MGKTEIIKMELKSTQNHTSSLKKLFKIQTNKLTKKMKKNIKYNPSQISLL